MKTTHHGENTRRWREVLGITQEELAQKLGMSQSTLSRLEQQEIIDEVTLEKISKTIGIPLKLLKECDHEDNKTKIVNFFNSGTQTVVDTQINNPLDTIISLYEKIIEQTKKIAELEAELDQIRKK